MLSKPEYIALGIELSWYSACLESWKSWVLPPTSSVGVNNCIPSMREVEAEGLGT